MFNQKSAGNIDKSGGVLPLHPPSPKKSANCGRHHAARITKGKLETLAWTAGIIALAILGTLALLKVGILAHIGTYSPYVTYGAFMGAGALPATALTRFIVKSCRSTKSYPINKNEGFFRSNRTRVPNGQPSKKKK